jgi:hypothetical protein
MATEKDQINDVSGMPFNKTTKIIKAGEISSVR